MTVTTTHHLPVLVNCGIVRGKRFIEPHAHPVTELFFVLEGSCRVETGKEFFDARPGQVFVWPGGVGHSAAPAPRVTLCYLTFEADALLFDTSMRMIEVGDDRWIRTWVEQLCSFRVAPCEGVDELAPGVLYALLRRLVQLEERRNGRRAMHPAVVRALRLIEKDIAAPFDIQSLSRQAMVSPSYLTALFREQVGTGPMKYIQQLRMNFARQQLRDPYLSVQEITYRCGYEDPNYFARLFRKFYAVSPTSYRERALEKSAAGATGTP